MGAASLSSAKHLALSILRFIATPHAFGTHKIPIYFHDGGSSKRTVYCSPPGQLNNGGVQRPERRVLPAYLFQEKQQHGNQRSLISEVWDKNQSLYLGLLVPFFLWLLLRGLHVYGRELKGGRRGHVSHYKMEHDPKLQTGSPRTRLGQHLTRVGLSVVIHTRRHMVYSKAMHTAELTLTIE
ncbi:hypothetical protein C8J57DRAFT_1268617 [Mycena rebaudengoi]|nr:hypothetical protein C8J57DRAFT_1268617 [Mycena rebaudengoi]